MWGSRGSHTDSAATSDKTGVKTTKGSKVRRWPPLFPHAPVPTALIRFSPRALSRFFPARSHARLTAPPCSGSAARSTSTVTARGNNS
uniref:Uncharacterized protein n=1 Tax=Oryza barthii TaxID=65489 RepID=A0A0D3FGR8_9ORYZ